MKPPEGERTHALEDGRARERCRLGGRAASGVVEARACRGPLLPMEAMLRIMRSIFLAMGRLCRV